MKQMKNILASVLVLCLMSLSAQNSKRIKGNGEIVSDQRETQEYSAISVSGFYEVHLVAGAEGQLTLEGESNLLEKIETYVEDDRLVVKSRKGFNLVPSRNKKVFVTIPITHIESAQFSGAGRVTSEKMLTNDQLYIRTSGARHVTLSAEATQLSVKTSGSSKLFIQGTSDKIEVRSSGSSTVSGYQMQTDNAKLTLSGSSDVKLTINESLTSRVSGSGNLRYGGNPDKITNKLSGSGSVRKVK